ncbi:AbrB/MazE/SpoVT family DNA-binding domain-containing protein [Microbaculum marinum]|uniref:AbrB/MazE/SpoVT family DNA-binding domain-containing protein n=1 Tax=Microbaculum marinum TaxID=1764581 RepID=A0AAW9RQZ4_9HYPH
MDTGTLTSKGQTTIPKAIRQRLGLKAGDRILYVVQDGEVVMRPANRPIGSLKEALPKPDRARSLEEMEEAVGEGASKA